MRSLSALHLATIGVSLSAKSTMDSAVVIGASIADADEARAIIELTDTAIATISAARGALGATQNRLESTINNLQVTTENLSASESRIRDTDMAAEMVNFTKNQILQQAGIAMLGQANSVPQSVLSLLQ